MIIDLDTVIAQLLWQIQIARDFDVRPDRFAATVALRVPERGWYLAGYVVLDDAGHNHTVDILSDKFYVGDSLGQILLLKIMQSFRSQVPRHGCLSVSLDRQRWLAWLDRRFPEQAILVEALLLVHHGLT